MGNYPATWRPGMFNLPKELAKEEKVRFAVAFHVKRSMCNPRPYLVYIVMWRDSTKSHEKTTRMCHNETMCAFSY